MQAPSRRFSVGLLVAGLMLAAGAVQAQQRPAAAVEARRLAAVGRYEDAARGLTTYLASHPRARVWEALGEVLLERSAVQVAEARVGDDLPLRVPGGGDRTLRLAGTVHAAGLAPARRGRSVRRRALRRGGAATRAA